VDVSMAFVLARTHFLDTIKILFAFAFAFVFVFASENGAQNHSCVISYKLVT
jgi:hypothetical protein